MDEAAGGHREHPLRHLLPQEVVGGHLDQGPALDETGQAVEHVDGEVALGVGDQRPVALRRQAPRPAARGCRRAARERARAAPSAPPPSVTRASSSSSSPSTAVSATSPPWRTTIATPSSTRRRLTTPPAPPAPRSGRRGHGGYAASRRSPRSRRRRPGGPCRCCRPGPTPRRRSREDVAVEVDHCANPRSGVVWQRRGDTMTGMIHHLPPLGLR